MPTPIEFGTWCRESGPPVATFGGAFLQGCPCPLPLLLLLLRVLPLGQNQREAVQRQRMGVRPVGHVRQAACVVTFRQQIVLRFDYIVITEKLKTCQ